MMEPAHLTDFHHRSLSRPLGSPGFWRVFVQRKRGAPLMVISAIQTERAAQRCFSKHDHVIQTFAANRAHDSFDVRPLPGRLRSRQYLFNAPRFPLLYKLVTEDPAPIPPQMPQCAVPRKRLPELACGSCGGGMS